LSTKKEGQGEREGSKATEDISDDEEKEVNWDEDMDKVCTRVEVQLYRLPSHYCGGSVPVNLTYEESFCSLLLFTVTLCCCEI
jgi:hypothetical protein